jgi:NADH-quinone oxidoreductase subunit H
VSAAAASLAGAPLAVAPPGPLWIEIVKAVVIFAVVLQIAPILVWAERRVLGRLQSRIGPNRVGFAGLMQPLADVIKLVSKEASTPATAVPWIMAIAPVISIATAVLTLAVVPFAAPGAFGGEFAIAGIDVSIGILYFFAFGSLAFYGIMLGGWASGSKYSFLGSMRAAAQLVSYEVAIGLSLLGVAITAGSLSLVDIVQAQDKIWFVVPQIVGFLIFMVAGFAEASRPPFDLPEADAELVQGYNTEFGGMRFGSFFMAEYLEIVVISAIAVAVFLGGWRGPGPEWLGPLWVFLKMVPLMFLFIWVRGTLPRFRYDQLMSFGWKVLLPLATVNVLVTAILVVVT